MLTKHAEQAQQDMNKAQDKVNDAAKENAEAAKAQAESNAKRQKRLLQLLRAAPEAPKN